MANAFLKYLTFPSLCRTLHSAISTSPNPTITSMEVEVKLRLPNAVTHQRVSSILSPYHLKTHAQENIFFDGANSELSSKLAVLRLRFYDLDTQCIISLKAKPVISNGISRIEEDEEPIDPSIGRACVSEPWRLPLIDSSRIIWRVKEEYGIGEKGLVCLGGFRNVRAVYEWNGLKLELDETHYDFGMNYEIECESCDPEKAKDLLEEFLKSHGIEYSYSNASKFAIFRSGKLPNNLKNLLLKIHCVSLLSPERVIFLGGLNLKFNPRSVNLLCNPLDLKGFTQLEALPRQVRGLVNVDRLNFPWVRIIKRRPRMLVYDPP